MSLHSKNEWVRGEIHTNNIESFWVLLKRGVIGTYHKVSRSICLFISTSFRSGSTTARIPTSSTKSYEDAEFATLAAASEHDKRAFVCADGLWYFWEPIENTALYNFRLSPRYKNTGSTPAKHLRSHVECDIRNTTLPPNHVFFDQN
ncbi:MAG: transposase [Candidatus Binataceae bacterium]|nr:transposase [Candidatus Binataceae bacterium]